MRLPRLLILALVVLAAGRAGAGYVGRGSRPPGGPLSAIWSATHIVVVTARPGGGVRVVESWLGDLKPGDPIDLPELYEFRPPTDEWEWATAGFAGRATIIRYAPERRFAPVVGHELPPIWDKADAADPADPAPTAWNPFGFSPNPRSPDGDPGRRAVLVLRRRVVEGTGVWPDTVAYFPAAGHITDCYADLDGDRLRFHGRRPCESCGPAGGATDAGNYRRLVAGIIRLREALRPALATGDGASVAAEVAWRLRGDPPEVQSLLLDLLDEAGPAARLAASADSELWRVQARSARRPAQVGAAGAWPDEQVGRPAALVPALDPRTLSEPRPAVAELTVLWCSVTRPVADLSEFLGVESVKRPSEPDCAPPAPAAPPVAVAAQPAPPAVFAAPCVCPPAVAYVAPCPPPVISYYVPCPPPVVIYYVPCPPPVVVRSALCPPRPTERRP